MNYDYRLAKFLFFKHQGFIFVLKLCFDIRFIYILFYYFLYFDVMKIL